jgi:hypothetical protein
MSKSSTLKSLTVLAAVLAAAPAFADSCTGLASHIGPSQTSDFTLGSFASNACVISDQNPDQGPNGNSSGFSPDPFDTGWTLLAKMESNKSPATLGGVTYPWGITFLSNKNGSWSFGADQSVKLDLVFAMHAGGYSGSFLFDDLTLTANQTQTGTWNIKWVNGGGSNPDYSNASLWVREVTPVPEADAYAMLLAGLGLIGTIARRRRGARA